MRGPPERRALAQQAPRNEPSAVVNASDDTASAADLGGFQSTLTGEQSFQLEAERVCALCEAERLEV